MDYRVGGIINIKVDGNVLLAKGAFSYNIGYPKREAVVGADGVHGFKETPQPSFIEGKITDTSELNLKTQILAIKNATVTLELANGKLVVLNQAYYAGDGTVNTEEGEIDCRFEGIRGNEVGV